MDNEARTVSRQNGGDRVILGGNTYVSQDKIWQKASPSIDPLTPSLTRVERGLTSQLTQRTAKNAIWLVKNRPTVTFSKILIG